jgi:hypothetical protein
VAALRFSRLSVDVGVRCSDPRLRRLLAGNYGAGGLRNGGPSLAYAVERAASGVRLTRPGARPRRARNAGHLLRLFDADLSVQLQRLRRRLYFLHAAVLVRHDRAALLVGASGAGKSTAAWALTHHGFRYAGDELAPLDVERLAVHPCPRGLCLKSRPPEPYALPADAARTSWGWHVPLGRLPGARRSRPVRLSAIFFVSHAGQGRGGNRVRRLGAADAAARLYAHALNPLAHPGRGLDPAVHLARSVPAFLLDARRLPEACRRVAAILDRAAP